MSFKVDDKDSGMTSSFNFQNSPSKRSSADSGKPMLLEDEGDAGFFSEPEQESSGRGYVRGQTPGPSRPSRKRHN